MTPFDVLAVMERDDMHAHAYRIVHGVIDSTPLEMADESRQARAAVADVINGLCVAVKALEKSDPNHPLLPNMRAALVGVGATP